jgi:4-hydroxymandelate synthase
MTTTAAGVFGDLALDHVEMYVGDAEAEYRRYADGYGLAAYARTAGPAPEARSIGLGRDDIRLILTEPRISDHPGAAYLEKHGDGVADISFGVTDPAAAFTEAVRRGARPIAAPREHGGIVQGTVMGFGDVAHTFVARPPHTDPRRLTGLTPTEAESPSWDSGLFEMDHFAVCLEAGQLDPTVQFYLDVFDFRQIFTERILVGAQAMNSTVVQSASGAVTFTLIEPDTSRAPGQIDEFLKNHNGAGVQHIAFAGHDIVEAVRASRDRGVDYLTTPATYYQLLTERVELDRHPVQSLRELNILVDEDHHGQLFQIFARSVHPRRTFFIEVIERQGARTFGSSNIKALYEAVELQRQSEQG